MPTFAVMLRGENFEIPVDGTPERMGFYTTRHVRADSEAEAEQRAVALVRQGKKLRAATRKDSAHTPMLFLESIERQPWWHVLKRSQGFVFWNMDAERSEAPSNNSLQPTCEDARG